MRRSQLGASVTLGLIREGPRAEAEGFEEQAVGQIEWTSLMHRLLPVWGTHHWVCLSIDFLIYKMGSDHTYLLEVG